MLHQSFLWRLLKISRFTSFDFISLTFSRKRELFENLGSVAGSLCNWYYKNCKKS